MITPVWNGCRRIDGIPARRFLQAEYSSSTNLAAIFGPRLFDDALEVGAGARDDLEYLSEHAA